METRANHVLVGSLTLLGFAGAIALGIWLAKFNLERQYAYYDIYFDNVTGLSGAGDVRYNGVLIGQVLRINVDPQDPGQVQVRIETSYDSPINEDTYATLELQGVTGVSYIALAGGDRNSQKLRPDASGTPPRIKAHRSNIQALFQDIPRLVENTTGLITDLRRLITTENQSAITNSLGNIEKATAQFADQLTKFGAFTDEIIESGQKFSQILDFAHTAIDSAQKAFKTSQTLAEGRITDFVDETRLFVDEGRIVLGETRKMVDNINGLVEENRKPIRDFTDAGFTEIVRFVREARRVSANIDQLVRRVENDPARFLLGTDGQEYSPR